MQLALATWANETTSPNAGAGTAAAVGSLWQRGGGALPTTPCEIYLKLNATNTGWGRQNVANLTVFNVRDYDAVGNGVCDDRPAIQLAINAAAANGGGIIYFPRGVYAVSRVFSGTPHSFDMSALHDITFLGDGYISQITAVGDAALGSWWVFYIHNGCARIRFDNMYFDGIQILNPALNNDEHMFQLFGAAGETAGTTDISFVGCFFDTIAGDMIAQKGESGREIVNTSVRFCAHNSRTSPKRSRSMVNSQRYVRSCMVHYNWATNAKSEIHQEPSGGSGADTAGPEAWSIMGNHLRHTQLGANAITLEGIGTILTRPAIRSACAHNMIIDGNILATGIKHFDIAHNTVLYNGLEISSEGVIYLFEGARDCQVVGNVAICFTTANQRAAFRSDANGPISGIGLIVSDNVFKTVAKASAATVLFEDCRNILLSGNLITMDTSDLDTGYGVGCPINDIGADHVSYVGNLVLAPSAILKGAFQFAANGGLAFHNGSASFNMASNSASGIRCEKATTQVYLDWRGFNGNNIGGTTTATIQPPANGCTIEGPAGPGAQIAMLQLAAGPDGVVTAPKGSLCANESGLASGVLFVKDGGSSVSGGSRQWSRVGATQWVFGAADVGAATTPRFLAPGGADLAVAGTAEPAVTVTRPGRLRTLRFACVAGVGGGVNTYTLRKNGADTGLLAAAANTSSSGTGNGATVSAVPGDRIGIKVTKSLSPGTPQTLFQITTELTG